VARDFRPAWNSWRRSRPFLGGLVIVAGGAEIVAVRLTMPIHSSPIIVPVGLLIAAGIIACGLLLLFYPVQRSVYATAAVLLAISALTTAHLGGYLAGTALAAAGGAVAFAWVPRRPPVSGRGGPPGFTLIHGEADGRPDRPDSALGTDRRLRAAGADGLVTKPGASPPAAPSARPPC
jgi:Family of unknown function (DUF6114)